jgi:hypothetical protein
MLQLVKLVIATWEGVRSAAQVSGIEKWEINA